MAVREIVDLTTSDDESAPISSTARNSGGHINDLDDVEEVSVRRIRRPSDDVVFVRQESRRADMPVLPGRGSRNLPPGIFSQLGRNSRTNNYGSARPATLFQLLNGGTHTPRWDNDELGEQMRDREWREEDEFEGDDDDDFLYPGPQSDSHGDEPLPHRHAGLLGHFIYGGGQAPHFHIYPYSRDAHHHQHRLHHHLHHRMVDQEYQRALSRSMLETHNRQPLDPEKIAKPPIGEVSEGFTRALNDEDNALLCAKCDNVLGEGEDERGRIFFRNCGHVYCGACAVEATKLRGKNRRCVVEGCVNKKGQKVIFKQVYS